MPYKRAIINGTSPLDMKGMNDNFAAIFLKLFGDINMSDIQDDIKSMLYTNWLQPQGEGNLDSTHPLEIRFYVPPNTKEVKTANLNIMASKYRVDSDVTSSANTIIKSSSVTDESMDKETSLVKWWGDNGENPWHPAPSTPMNKVNPWNSLESSRSTEAGDDFLPGVYDQEQFSTKTFEDRFKDTTTGESALYGFMQWFKFAWVTLIDFWDFQHTHDMKHKHTLKLTLDIDGHSHSLNMGIKEATNQLANIKVSIVNSGGINDIGIVLSETNRTANEIDIADKIKIGEWNTIKVTSTDLARVTVFGIVELLQNYR